MGKHTKEKVQSEYMNFNCKSANNLIGSDTSGVYLFTKNLINELCEYLLWSYSFIYIQTCLDFLFLDLSGGECVCFGQDGDNVHLLMQSFHEFHIQRPEAGRNTKHMYALSTKRHDTTLKGAQRAPSDYLQITDEACGFEVIFWIVRYFVCQ